MVDFTHDGDRIYHFEVEAPHLDKVFLLCMNLLDEDRQDSLKFDNLVISIVTFLNFTHLGSTFLLLSFAALGT